MCVLGLVSKKARSPLFYKKKLYRCFHLPETSMGVKHQFDPICMMRDLGLLLSAKAASGAGS